MGLMMKISDILKEEFIKCNVEVNNKTEAINLVFKIMQENHAVKPEYLQSMIKRDEKVSVAIGNLLAIAHGEENSDNLINHNFICLIHLKNEIEWDNNLVKVVLGLAVSRESTMEIIGNIGVAFSDLDEVNKIFKSSDVSASKILQWLNSFNE